LASRKGRTGGGEQMGAPKGFKQMAVLALEDTKAFVLPGRILFDINGFRTSCLTL